MDTGIYDLKINQYSDYNKVLNFKDDNDNNIDLTTYTADLVIRDSQVGTTTILALDETSGLTLASNGNLTITIANATSSTLSTNKYWYYLELTTAGGSIDRYLQGDVYINLR